MKSILTIELFCSLNLEREIKNALDKRSTVDTPIFVKIKMNKIRILVADKRLPNKSGSHIYSIQGGECF